MPASRPTTRTGPDPLLLDGIDALGWTGTVVDRVRMFGERVTVVATVDHQAHADRVASGWAPVMDAATLTSWDELPELWPTVPPRVVRLVGICGRYRTWRGGMAGAGRLSGFAATAFLVERDPGDEGLLNALWYGVGVLRAAPDGGVRLVQSGHNGPAPTSRYGALRRESEEIVYRRLILDGVLTGPPGA
ncbi:hypothetical protein [Actinocatenispora rupis]|uniref:Uncharacterized protein n=1 Tax=Actinocatenispora rupis TaxID=519421 RepID=A0A8J3J6G9_9ACTN|nr:hypothetical protein [Actinocatenispora rupis]GID10273.1 hypothetical protein Aru02nite_11620 [Actinocatenispora rupis]